MMMKRDRTAATAKALCLVACIAISAHAQSGPTIAVPAPNPLFDLTQIVSVHLAMTKEDFAALAPTQVRPSGMPGGPGRGPRLVGGEGKRNGLASAMGIEFQYVHADLTIGDKTLKNIGVRYKGNGTYIQGRMSQKISFKLDLNQFVKGQKLNGVKTLNLHNNVADISFMTEELAFVLFREAGVAAPRTSYAKVYLKVAGDENERYLGLYSLVENPNEDFVAARGLPKDGAIFKPVTPSLFTDIGPDWKAYNQIYDPKTDITEEQKQRVIDMSRLVTAGSDDEFEKRAAEFLDLDAWARFMATTVFLSDMDGILRTGQNYYLYLHPKTNKFSVMAWDQDHSFGQFQRGSQTLDILKPSTSRFVQRLFAIEAFRSPYLGYLKEFTAGIFRPARIAGLVDRVAAAIRPAIEQESAAKVAQFDQAVRGEIPPAGNGGGFFGGPVVPVKPFVEARSASVAEQLGKAR